MRIRLNITYRTEWGQSLAVVVTWNYSDGRQLPVTLPLNCDEGQLWTLTIEPRTSRTRRLLGCTYHYIVTDNKGIELRREAAERNYALASDHDYLFRDRWIDEGASMLVSDNVEDNAATKGETRMPLFQQTLLFRVEAFTLKPSEALGLLGSHPALGAWNTGSYLKMEKISSSEWQLSVDACQFNLPLEYKYVVVDDKTGAFLRWEDGFNRTTGAVSPSVGEVLVLRGEPLRTPEPPFMRLQQLVDWAQEQGLRVMLVPNGAVPVAGGESKPSPKNAFIFDLDGTLLDTLEDLMLSVNHALKSHHMAERSLDEVRGMVGNGVRKLVERAVPDGTTAEEVEKVFYSFSQHYMEHSLDHTHPYPGIIDLLAELHRRGCPMAVVSNKMHKATEQLVHRFFSPYIQVAVGEDEQRGIRRKPSPDMVAEALRLLGGPAGDVYYVGDSNVDIETAANCGLPCISVLWGFRSKEHLLRHGATRFVSRPEEIIAFSSQQTAK